MASFKLMCWNVQNLFPANHEFGPNSSSKFDAKVAALARLINQERPDILALQEVGTAPAFDELRGKLEVPLANAVVAEPGARGIRVAFLSRFAIQDSKQISAFPNPLRPIQARDHVGADSASDRCSRPALQITVNVAGQPVRIFTAHLKSKLIGYPSGGNGTSFGTDNEGERARFAAYALYQRTAEAVTIRAHLNEVLGVGGANLSENGRGRTLPLIFCGDLNDEPHAATTQIIQGPSGSEFGTSGFEREDKYDGARMWNLAPKLTMQGESIPYTRKYRGRGELIDHIFVSHMLAQAKHLVDCRVVPGVTGVPNMDDNPNSNEAGTGSDHAAVVANFQL